MQKINFIIAFLIVGFSFLSFKSKPIKVFLVGDSTMADKPSIEDNPERGWGMVLPSFFNNNVLIENHARNGRSTKTFIVEGRWNFVMNRIKKGDYVFIQFSHNDEVKEKKSYTPIDEFKTNFERMVSDVRAKGAIPILCTPVVRRKFDSIGNLVDTHPDYPKVIRSVAQGMKVKLIDMQAKSAVVVQKYGVEASKKLFMNIAPGIWKKVPDGREDNTHFVEAGALEMAKCAIKGITELNIKPLKNNLTKSANFKLKLTTPVEGIENIKSN